MAYSSDIAKILTEQLTKFATLNRHQLVGHGANLDFWVGEVRHCLEVIDGYGARFNRLKSAQTKHASEHQTTYFDLEDPCCIRWHADPPKRVPDTELKESRRSLSDATFRFLVRCFNEAVIDESLLRRTCDSLGIAVEARDLKRRSEDVSAPHA